MENTSTVKLFWWDGANNAGDTFGPYIFDKLGVKFEKYEGYHRSIITCGSIIEQALPWTLVWGSGLHNIGNKIHFNAVNVKAVRGYLTIKYLGLPNVTVGDPGLLLSALYKPKTKKKYKFGIVSHFVDYDEFKDVETSDIPVINMAGDVEEIADKMNECEFIFSSSLHGVIFAHSLGIPAVHVLNKPLVSRNSFKFKDYYSVFNSIEYTECKWNPDLSFVYNYINEPEKYKPTIDEVKTIQKNLIDCFPYKERVTKWDNLNL